MAENGGRTESIHDEGWWKNANHDSTQRLADQFDFNTWQWFLQSESAPPVPPAAIVEGLASPEHFTWLRSKEGLEQELFSEGVVRIGSVSDQWLNLAQHFCKTNPFDNVMYQPLSLSSSIAISLLFLVFLMIVLTFYPAGAITGE